MADFSELSYAAPEDSAPKRWLIQVIERLSGRPALLPLYRAWRSCATDDPARLMRAALRLLDVRVEVVAGHWPDGRAMPAPLVLIANHPFGIADGLVMLAMAESIGRPYRVFVDKRLLKIPELRPLALPIDFSPGRAALRTNIRSRRIARDLLRRGETVVIFPAGGVATARWPWGPAIELPWKNFAARLVQHARAAVLPVHFEGQNSALFHLVSHISLTLRLSLLVSEFLRRIRNATVRLHIFEPTPFDALRHPDNARLLTEELHALVHRGGLNGDARPG